MTFPLYGGFVSFPLDMKPPYSDQWNVSVQRQVGDAWMVSANYLSSRGYRLPIGDQLNPAMLQPGRDNGHHQPAAAHLLENPRRRTALRGHHRRRSR